MCESAWENKAYGHNIPYLHNMYLPFVYVIDQLIIAQVEKFYEDTIIIKFA